MRELKQSLQDQLQAAQAITQSEQNRVAILQQINAFERENGKLMAGQREELEKLLAATQQAEAFKGLQSTLDPQTAAIQKYKDDMATLRAELDAGRISKEKFDQMGKQLDRSSLQARDPIGGELKSLQQQQELLKIGGDYKDADRKTQETINRLTEQGVTITKGQVEQLSAANRQLQDMEKAQNSGLTGWANSVGSLKDNLMDMTKDFASDLSSAISGALEGKRGGFTAMLRKLGSNMISTGVNQLMKQAIQGVQNGTGGQGGGLGGLILQDLRWRRAAGGGCRQDGCQRRHGRQRRALLARHGLDDGQRRER